MLNQEALNSLFLSMLSPTSTPGPTICERNDGTKRDCWIYHHARDMRVVCVSGMKGTVPKQESGDCDGELHPEGAGEARQVSPDRPEVEGDEEQEDHDADHLPVSRP